MTSLAVTQVHEGVVFDPTNNSKAVPMWIVDQVDVDKETHYVAISEIAPDSINDFYKHGNDMEYLEKTYKFVQYEQNPYGKAPLTKLAKKAKVLFDKQSDKIRVKLYQKPLFTTIVTYDEDTFNHKYGLGFYEHERSRYQLVGNKSIYTVGKATGVFISLDRIIRLKDFIPKDNLIRVLQDEIDGVDANYIDLDTGADSYFDYQ